MLEFHPALTYERFCDLFSVLVGGITVETAPDIPLVFLWTLCKVFSLGSTRQYSGELFRSFAAKDSRKTLLTKRHTYCSLIRTCVHLVQKFLPVLILKARLIRNLLLNDRVHSIWKNRCWRTICFAVLTHSSHCEINDTLTIAWSRTGVHLVQKFLPVLV